jgi:predicted dehydrogenase
MLGLPDDPPVRLGSIGLGWWGGVLANSARSTGLVDIVACFARSADSRKSFAGEHGCLPFDSLDALLASDVDGVLIATPHTTHAGLVIAAAEASKHVFVDKPLTLTVAEATRAVDAAEAAGVVLQVGHNRRRQPANRRIKESIDSGALGAMLEVSATHAAPLLFNPNLAPWRRRLEETPVGGMAALGIHQVDTLHYLAGPIEGVFARSTRLLPEGEVDDTTTVVFQFKSGIQGHLFTSMATGPVVEVIAHGTEAIARNTGDGENLTLQRRGSTELVDMPLDPLDTIADELTEFSRAIRGGAQPETDGVEARKAVAVLEAIVESAAANRWVELVYP